MRRTLVVEDEKSIAGLEKDYLELNGFDAGIENEGTARLEKALHEGCDLFILNSMLPGMDGFGTCQKIHEVENTPVIVVSAEKEGTDKIHGLGLGADGCIIKPFSPSEMVTHVKAHIAQYERLVGSGVPNNEVIEVHGPKVDKTARRV